MAAHKYVLQQQETVSFYRKGFLNKIVYNDNLNLKDIRICLLLLTQLNGYRNFNEMENYGQMVAAQDRDPLNFSRVDIESIADALEFSEKQVRKSLNKLVEEEILEKGSNQTIKKGYRFII